MPVPSSISDLSTIPALNSPPGSESPSLIDDYLRAYAAFIKQINDLAATKADASALASKADASALASKADDSAVVKLTGAQTVAGTKTFSESPVAPNPTAGTRSQALATMQMFALEFGSLLSGNGYQKLPSGWIIQWGSVESSNTGAVVITLPVAFPNAGFQAFSTPKDTSTGNASAAEMISISQLKVSAWVVSSGGWIRTPTTIQWFAIGH